VHSGASLVIRHGNLGWTHDFDANAGPPVTRIVEGDVTPVTSGYNHAWDTCRSDRMS
jgi:hypothetical protein